MGGPGTPLPPWAPAVLPQTHHAGTAKATPAALLPSPRPEGRDTTRDTEPQSPRPHCPAAQHADPAPSPSSMAPAPRTRAQSFSATASSGTGWERRKTVSEAAAAQSRADCRGPRCRARETLKPSTWSPDEAACRSSSPSTAAAPRQGKTPRCEGRWPSRAGSSRGALPEETGRPDGRWLPDPRHFSDRTT